MNRVKLTLLEIVDPLAYDEVVRSAPLTSALQGWGYGQARKAIGYVPHRFLITRGQETVGALQLLRMPLKFGFSWLYAPRGPALWTLEDLPELAIALKRWARYSDVLIKLEPPSPVPSDDPIPEAFGPWQRGSTEQPEHTIALDLTRSEDELFSSLHSMVRRNVRTAQKFGVQAARDANFEDFWTIFHATNERAKLGAFPRGYYTTMLEQSNKYGGEAYTFLSRYGGKALAGGFFLGMGKGVYYLFGGSVRDDRVDEAGAPLKDVKAPTLFYWNAILDAKRRGYEFFDFWGIPRELDESKHSYGVFKMKEGFGGARMWYPAYELDLNPLARLARAKRRERKTQLNLERRGTAEDVL